MPLMVHSTWRAPACTAASELATASPRSLWQCADSTARVADALADGGEHALDVVGQRVADRVGQVDRGRAGVDRRLGDLAQEVQVAARRVLGRELDVVAIGARVRAPPAATCSRHCARVMRSLCSRWMSEVARNT